MQHQKYAHTLAQHYLQNQNPQKAKYYFTLSISNSNNLNSILNLTILYIEIFQDTQNATHYITTHNLLPLLPHTTLNNLAILHEKSQNYPQAEHFYNTSFQKQPNPIALSNLIELHLHTLKTPNEIYQHILLYNLIFNEPISNQSTILSQISLKNIKKSLKNYNIQKYYKLTIFPNECDICLQTSNKTLQFNCCNHKICKKCSIKIICNFHAICPTCRQKYKINNNNI